MLKNTLAIPVRHVPVLHKQTQKTEQNKTIFFFLQHFHPRQKKNPSDVPTPATLSFAGVRWLHTVPTHHQIRACHERLQQQRSFAAGRPNELRAAKWVSAAERSGHRRHIFYYSLSMSLGMLEGRVLLPEMPEER